MGRPKGLLSVLLFCLCLKYLSPSRLVMDCVMPERQASWKAYSSSLLMVWFWWVAVKCGLLGSWEGMVLGLVLFFLGYALLMA